MTPLIHWDFSGKNNADAGTIVEDLTGNGYDLELKNFAFDNESGYNGYPFDFRKLIKSTSNDDENTYDGDFPINIQENKVIFNGTIADNKTSCGIQGTAESTIQTFIIKITGLRENQVLRWYNYKYENEKGIVTTLYNGINIIDGSGTEIKYLGYYAALDGNIGKTLDNVTVEIFPLYPDYLVFNNTNGQTVKPVKINNTRGFTVIYNRKFIEKDVVTAVIGQMGNSGTGSDFYIRDYLNYREDSTSNYWAYYTFGTNGIISEPKDGFAWSTLKTLFNGNQIHQLKIPTLESPDNASLQIGGYSNSAIGHFSIQEVYVFDRNLTQSQIEKFISDNMIPLPEVYYDVEKQGTLNEHTTKDKLIDFSGNQHHGTLHNFTFDETNGWGYYPLDNLSYDSQTNSPGVTKLGDYKFAYNGCQSQYCYYSYRNITGEHFTPGITVPSFRIKITGLDKVREEFPNGRLIVQATFLTADTDNTDVSNSHTFTSDGIHTITSYQPHTSIDVGELVTVRLVDFFFFAIGETENTITVEFLPTDEDCLRFKGAENSGDIDTGTYVDSFYNTGFKTIFLLVDNDDAAKPGYFYDQRKNKSENNWHFGLYYGSNSHIAYNYRNSGTTYINGVINTTIGSGTLQGKRCITIVDDAVNDTNSQSPVIGSQTHHTYTSNMKLYKFLGFKEALSEKQIKMVIEKYGLQVD